jgi:hypothetical protein
LIPFF